MSIPGLLGAALAGGAGTQMGFTLYPPLGFKAQTAAWESNPINLPMVQELVTLRRQGRLSADEYTATLLKFGYNPQWSERVYAASQTQLSAFDYVSLYRRGIMGEQELYARLKMLGFEESDMSMVVKAAEFFPSAQDFITFAVREVYSDKERSRFGLDDDRPPRFMEESAKAGIDPEHAKNYWAAHWRLPSVLQGFEMMHRGVIDGDDLNLLLKAADVMPFWRDKLTAISYNPLTRVDVRRMYSLGVLDEEAVHKAYKDIGYSDENAELMRQFTVEYENSETAGITRSRVISAYKDGVIDESELKAYLTALGYSPGTVEFHVKLSTHERDETELKELIAEITDQYRLGLIDDDELGGFFAGLDAPQYYINTTLAKIRSTRSKRVKLSTKGDLLRWLEKNILSDEEFSAKMIKLGYTQDDIGLYLTEYRLDVEDIPVRRLGVKTYAKWFALNIIDRSTFERIMKEMDISDADIQRSIEEAIMAKQKKETKTK